MSCNFKIAICQMRVDKDKQENIHNAQTMIKKAAAGNANLAVLPEMFNCPYENSKFPVYVENLKSSETIQAISNTARESGIYVVAGSIPEADAGRIYNSSVILSKNGDIIGVHRKMHLFDIDVEGRIRFKESDTLSPGGSVTTVDTEFCRIGIAICYDMRFPELIRLMALKDAKVIIIPAAFNMVTGPAHWELLIRTRALDNQVFIAAASPARDKNSSYVAYGNSMVAGPWGDVKVKAGDSEELLFYDIDLRELDKVRNELPLLKHRRNDLYELREK